MSLPAPLPPPPGGADLRAGTDPLVGQVYEELRDLACRFLRRERVGHTLQPTALVHEAYLRLAAQGSARWREREHLLAVASEIIRRVLVDHARRRSAERRGGHLERVTLSEDVGLSPDGEVDVLALDEALDKLRGLHERQVRVVELRFFGGLSALETSRALGVSERTVHTDWRMARAWLTRELERRAGG